MFSESIILLCSKIQSSELSRRQLRLLEKHLEGKYSFSRKQKCLAIRPDCCRMLEFECELPRKLALTCFVLFFFLSLFPAVKINVQSICLKQGDDVLWETFAISLFQGAVLPVLLAGLNECSVPLLIFPDLCFRELIVQTSGRLQMHFWLLALVPSCIAVASSRLLLSRTP